jgi:phage N-6-adenine-methyltransferase
MLPDNYTPVEGLKLVALAETAEKYFRRAKDTDKLCHAIEVKLTEQRRFVLWWDGQRLHGRPKKALQIGNSLRRGEVAVDGVTIHRWRTRLKDDENFTATLAATQERCVRACEANSDSLTGYSSATPEWETPQDLFDVLDAEFHFTLDVCATPDNAKCKLFFSEKDDGLAQEWRGVCWMNPPYGDEIPEWIGKAHQSAADGATVVCLVPARTDTAWWWDHCRHGEIRFLRGRLKFGGADAGAPFPSAVVVFPSKAKVVWWEWKPT